MSRKIPGILLFLITFTPFVTTYLVLKHQKKQVKREIKWRMIAGMDKEELVLLKFTEQQKTEDLNWKHSKEFEFKGEMYDIVETEVIRDTTYYRCWWDHEETRLNKKLKELVAIAMGKSPFKKENQQHLQDYFRSFFFHEKNIDPIHRYHEEKAVSHLPTVSYKIEGTEPPSNPPELG